MDQRLLEKRSNEDMWAVIQVLCCGFESRVDFFFIIFLTYFFSTSRVRVRFRIWVGVILSLKKIHGQVLVTRCSSGSEIALTYILMRVILQAEGADFRISVCKQCSSTRIFTKSFTSTVSFVNILLCICANSVVGFT